MVPSWKRHLSHMEFYHRTLKLHKELLTSAIPIFENFARSNNFGALRSTMQVECNDEYYEMLIKRTSESLLYDINELLRHVTAGNSIYPSTIEDCLLRREEQQRAINSCNSIITTFDYMANLYPRHLKTAIKYTDEFNELQKLLRGWKKSTNKVMKELKNGTNETNTKREGAETKVFEKSKATGDGQVLASGLSNL